MGGRSGSIPALVILAAGESTRLGRCKALVPLTPRTPLELLCAAGACFADAPALVITGADHDEIAAAAPPGVEVRFNPDWRAGRSGGVLLALRHRPGRDFCIAPVDVPLVPYTVFEALLAAWMAADFPSRGWLAPSYTPPSIVSGSVSGIVSGVPGPKFGHPILVGRKLLLDLAERGPATPLHGLRERAKPLFSVEVDHPEVLDDLDTPEDFQRMRIRSRG